MAVLPESADLQRARRDFFERRARPNGVVPEIILRSWQRCASLGLDTNSRAVFELPATPTVRQASERFEWLRRLCRPEVDGLYRDACETTSILIVTDADGLVLDTCGNDDFMARAARVALRRGAQWHEVSAGTNAIGTALAERRSVAVRGAQHFLEANRILDCFAVPIVDPHGAIVGALDLSGPAGAAHTHALGLVRVAVDHIEHRFFEAPQPGSEVLRFHHDASLLGTSREGVLVFRDGRLESANRSALELLRLDYSALGQWSIGQLFTLPRRPGAPGSAWRTRDGRPFAARFERAARRSSQAVAAASRPQVWIEPRMQAQLERAARMLDADVPVLLQGETGTGKEVCARELHALSRRAQGPFVAVNCAAVPEGLIEAELFGYEPGAYTGARREGSPGMVRRAAGGTLLLDEIGDMPLPLQSRLLRVLQEREVVSLGGGNRESVDFALVCSTHRPLAALVRGGAFREDLYYRIAQYRLPLAPLREHSDLRALIRHLWQGLGAQRHGELPATVLSELAARAWPGNFRQLVSVLKILCVHADAGEALDCTLLPPDSGLLSGDAANEVRSDSDAAPPPSAGSLGDLERLAIERALEASGGNVSAAARRLGVSRSTLYRRGSAGGR